MIADITTLKNETTMNKLSGTKDSSKLETNPGDMGREEFMTMLVKQLEYQDPMNPMNNTEFTAQLAQFSSLEQLFNINKKLDTLNASNSAGSEFLDAGYLGYLGRTAKAYSDEYVHDGSPNTTFSYQLAENAKTVTISLIDAKGDVAKTLTVDQPQLAGANAVALDTRGLASGTYQVVVNGKSFSNDDISATLYQEGRVSGVSMQNGQPMLTINGSVVPAGKVYEIKE